MGLPGKYPVLQGPAIYPAAVLSGLSRYDKHSSYNMHQAYRLLVRRPDKYGLRLHYATFFCNYEGFN